jgi:SPP1 gp7 family putative phage head morphogenesis protein
MPDQDIPIIAVRNPPKEDDAEKKKKLYRSLTVYEEASKVDFIEIDTRLEGYVESTTNRLVKSINDLQDSIISQVRRSNILTTGNMRLIRDIVIAPKKLQDGVKHVKNIVLNSLGYVYLDGRLQGLTEVESSLGKKVKFDESSGPFTFTWNDTGYSIANGHERFRAMFADIADVKPKEALDKFKHKVPMTKRQFSRLLDTSKGRAFTVAGLIEKDVLRNTQELLYKAIDEGASIDDFAFALKQSNIKYTGTVYGTDLKKGLPITPVHTEVILRTNFATVYNNGRWDLFNDPAVVEFVPAYQYSAILDQRTREIHRKMDKRIYPRNDPVWKKWKPPAGYNCRCQLTAVTINMDYIVSAPTALRPDPGFGSLSDARLPRI